MGLWWRSLQKSLKAACQGFWWWIIWIFGWSIVNALPSMFYELCRIIWIFGWGIVNALPSMFCELCRIIWIFGWGILMLIMVFNIYGIMVYSYFFLCTYELLLTGQKSCLYPCLSFKFPFLILDFASNELKPSIKRCCFNSFIVSTISYKRIKGYIWLYYKVYDGDSSLNCDIVHIYEPSLIWRNNQRLFNATDGFFFEQQKLQWAEQFLELWFMSSVLLRTILSSCCMVRVVLDYDVQRRRNGRQFA